MGPGDFHDSRYSWLRLAITLLIAIVGNVGMWAIIVILPAIQSEFGVDRSAASLPYAAAMVGFALGNLVIGWAVDRFGISLCLIAAAIGVALSFAFAALTGSVLMLSIAQVIVGFGSATSFGPLIADISHWFLRRRGIAVAVAASGNYLSGAIWPFLLAGVLEEQGWRVAYLLLAGVVLLVMLPLSLLLRRSVPHMPANDGVIAVPGRAGRVSFTPGQLQMLLAAAGIACCMAMAMPQVHIVALCVDLGYGPTVGAEMLSLMLLGGVASRLVSGFVADLLGGVRTLLIGSVLQCIALFLFLPFDGLVSLYLVSLVFGLAQGGIVPSYAIIVREYMPAREAGARVGAVMMATIIGMALGGWMSGWIYDMTGSYQMAFINGIVWNFLNIGIMVLILLNASRGGRRAAAAISAP
ncbi:MULTISPECIES: MFS transporter [Paracoccaceae]|jgi:MFS family permease|uniref:MFS transporter n=1 Tax=Rhodobacterales TaxID=204455 RepID=UPI001AFD28BA|nr:MFS transporter [Boseongicola sp. H5]MBO6603178.1 MFS transporter [Roseicyclus sp.]MBO6623683.1 MFS transporter [Roseicyclus sp.]MBO6922864.1 MFS transporter [Roseicyclus sp.]